MEAFTYSNILAFFQGNIPAAIGAVLVAIFLAYKKPKLFFLMLLFVSILVGLIYIISFVSDIGTTHKKSMVDRVTVH
jgi:hypothetical protein